MPRPMATSSHHHLLPELLESLDLPQEFKKYENATPQQQEALQSWTQKAPSRLNDLKLALQGRYEDIDIEALGKVVAKVSPFAYDVASLCGDDGHAAYEEERNVLGNETPWITPSSKASAQEILLSLDTPRKGALVKHVLEHIVKPIFRASNPHPHINPATGRSLPPSKDFFESEGQIWKNTIGLGAIVYWCIDNIEPGTYMDVWHHRPPVMTFLDDYQPRYKLWGLLVAQRMLRDVSPNLLKTTGIHGLLKSSFRKILAHQLTPLPHNPSTIDITGSKDRFDNLTELLGEGIIDNIWTYTFDKPEAIRATLDALPELIQALDIGCTRFLQSLLPQLLHPLTLPSNQGPIPGRPSLDLLQLQLQNSALRALIPLMRVCAPRIHGWRLTILDALVRCWVTMVSDPSDGSTTASPYQFEVPANQGDSDDEDEGDVREALKPTGYLENVDVEGLTPTQPIEYRRQPKVFNSTSSDSSLWARAALPIIGYR
ncbi:hypothetical protein D9611_015047 [Ephemerocybe angulata]|uniref:Uncharacterized protein n=1 Tax=Ephemerocybe angulata TaxID=980116 RepID=A0A8H5CBP7_9AGAR|nr:hypothetical protein D9611_015047 [Tulosesus angulatus]